ncbi:hypothetical protein QJS10_CPB15g01140 [Acorus calamus]|uniref:Casein kinase II subunit beta n=1 Tax=Acorus calamus TaxID=4465 RepID=A0AAV9D7V8_ACOCL|nr:hypothetical protein QJS10_CPB15g01140 [Acorus calamus]
MIHDVEVSQQASITISIWSLKVSFRYRKRGTDLSSSEGDDSSLISWFCGLRGTELLCEVDEDYIQDDFNLCGLQGQMLQILNIMLQDVKSKLLAHGVDLEVSDAVMDIVCHQGYDKSNGARPLRRAVIQLIEDVISESRLSEEYQPGDVAVIDVDDSGKPFVSHRSDNTVHLIDAASTF